MLWIPNWIKQHNTNYFVDYILKRGHKPLREVFLLDYFL